MRLFAILSLVATLSRTSLAQGGRSAQVYLWPSEQQATEGLHPLEAVSHHLGFDGYDSLGDRTEDQWDALKAWTKDGKSGVGEGAQDAMLIVIQSDHPKDFIPAEMTRTYSIPNPPAAETFTDLIHAFTERAHQSFDSVFSSLDAAVKAVKEAVSPTYKALLDIFDMTSASAATFVTEFEQLAGLLDSDQDRKHEDNGDDNFSAFEVKGLAQLEKDYGRDSEQYLTAAKGMQAVLSNPALQRRRVALIVIPTTERPSHEKRSLTEGGAQEPFSSPPSNKVVFSISTCFPSNETCAEKTNSCSGHGACSSVTRAGKTCYACSCVVTKNDQGRRQWWAGQSCERKDLSTSFVLLAGTTIFLIVLIGFAISLIYYVGSESLPNTLTAGAVSHGKRD